MVVDAACSAHHLCGCRTGGIPHPIRPIDTNVWWLNCYGVVMLLGQRVVHEASRCSEVESARQGLGHPMGVGLPDEDRAHAVAAAVGHIQ